MILQAKLQSSKSEQDNDSENDDDNDNDDDGQGKCIIPRSESNLYSQGIKAFDNVRLK